MMNSYGMELLATVHHNGYVSVWMMRPSVVRGGNKCP